MQKKGKHGHSMWSSGGSLDANAMGAAANFAPLAGGTAGRWVEEAAGGACRSVCTKFVTGGRLEIKSCLKDWPKHAWLRLSIGVRNNVSHRVHRIFKRIRAATFTLSITSSGLLDSTFSSSSSSHVPRRAATPSTLSEPSMLTNQCSLLPKNNIRPTLSAWRYAGCWVMEQACAGINAPS